MSEIVETQRHETSDFTQDANDENISHTSEPHNICALSQNPQNQTKDPNHRPNKRRRKMRDRLENICM